MIIDGHAHSCGNFFTVQGIVDTLDKLSVDKVVLCPGLINDEKNHYVPNLATFFKNTDIMNFANKIICKVNTNNNSINKLDKANEYVYNLLQKLPERIIQFYWADPTKKNIIDELQQRYEDWNYSGIKLHQCSEQFSSTSYQMHQISDFAEYKGIPIFIHLYSNKDAIDMIELIRNHPNTTFIIAHLIGMELFEKNQKDFANTYFDISPAPLISKKRIECAIDKFGSDHMILGSDTPYGKSNLQSNIQKIEMLKIPDREKEQILGLNIQRILNLKKYDNSKIIKL